MEQAEVIRFFDALAPAWDAGMVRDEDKIREILDDAGVCAGKRVLDVACGTGVLFPDYQKRGVRCVTAVDLSPKMAELAAAKVADARITVLCGDVETLPFAELFDCIVVYNALPHFPQPERLLCRLAGLLAPGGRLVVAHSMGRAALQKHHSGGARRVSVALPSAATLATLMGCYLAVDTATEDAGKYIVAGAALPHGHTK